MKKILIQDADSSIREILYIYFKEEDFEVYTFSVAKQDFIEAVKNRKPDVILLDYLINGVESIACCKQIKALNPNIPVMAMSTQARLAHEYSAKGFDGYIIKPFDLDSLSKIILTSLEKSQ